MKIRNDTDRCDQCVSWIDLKFSIGGMRLCLFCAAWSTPEMNDEYGEIGTHCFNPGWWQYAEILGVRISVPRRSHFFFSLEPWSASEALIADAYASGPAGSL